jgi:superfamily I DNA/RNA helicase
LEHAGSASESARLYATLGDAQSLSVAPLDRIQSFLEDLTLDKEKNLKKESNGEAVTLITMHSCKTLEFLHVYLVGLDQGLFAALPLKDRRNARRRTAAIYVAITRAVIELGIFIS